MNATLPQTIRAELDRFELCPALYEEVSGFDQAARLELAEKLERWARQLRLSCTELSTYLN